MMKNKLLFRRLALLLCLSLIVGILPITALSVPVLTSVTDSTTNLLTNGDFATDLSSWSGSHANGDDKVEVVEGAAKFTATTKSIYLVQTVGVTDVAGDVFTLTFDFTRISGTKKPYAIIKCRDASSTLIYERIEMDATQQYTVDITAPDGTVQVYVELGNNSSVEASYTIDNVSLTKTTASTEPTNATESTESTEATAATSVVLEAFMSGSSVPSADDETWVESNGGEETALEGSHNSVKRGTDNKLVFQAPTANVQYYAKSPLVSVTGGYTYTANYQASWYFSTTVEDSIELIFVDAQGNVLAAESADAFNTGAAQSAWHDMSFSAVAPGEAVGMYVKFNYCVASGGNNYWVRNLTVTEIAAADPTETTAPTETTTATEPEMLVNGDFEDGTNGWPSSSALTSCTEDKHGGNASMKFTDSNGTAGGPYFQQTVTVEPGKTYKLSAWVKVLEGTSGYIGVYGISPNSVQKSFGSAGDWKQVELTAVIPEGKSEAKIEIGANSGSGTTFLIDDITFVEEVSEETQPTETTVATEATNPTETTVATEATNPTETTAATENTDTTEGTEATVPGYIFSDFFASTGVPGADAETWVESNGGEETVLEGSHISVKRGADNKLVFQAPTANVQYYAKSPLISSTGGMTYTANYQASWYFSTTVEDSIELIFVDAQGNVLAAESADAFNTGAAQSAWHDMSFSAVAPGEAVGMYVKFNYCVASGGNNYWLRNLTVTETETPVIPTEPYDPNLMLKENFETFVDENNANSGPLGWTSSDDSRSIYSVAVSCAQLNSIKQDGYYLAMQMTGNWTVQSPAFDVKPGYEYTADFLARKLVDNENYNGYLTVCFVDMFGLQLQAEQVTVGKTYGQWAEETVKAIAPAGAAKAYLIFGLDNDSRSVEADYAIDNLKVTQSTEPAIVLEEAVVLPTKTVFEDSFDNYTVPEGSSGSCRIPNGWTPSTYGAALASAQYIDYNGTMNLTLQDLPDKWIKSPLIDAVPGYTYTAVFMEKKLNPAAPGTGGYVKIVFVDDSGNILSEVTEAIGTAANWSRNGIQALAPAGATKLYVEFGLANAAGSSVSYAVEDLQVIEAAGALFTVGGGDDYNPTTGDSMAPALVSTLMIMTVVCAVLLLKKRRSF